MLAHPRQWRLPSSLRELRTARLIALVLALDGLLAVFSYSNHALAEPWDDVVAAHLRGDNDTAFRLVLPLAEEGHPDAQGFLGYMYDHGLGVAADIGKAVHWYRLAAEQGNAGAQTNLCASYANGYGVALDLKKAAHWCRLAAQQGYDGAQYNLGAAYYDGKGVGQDYVQAYMWFVLAERSARHPNLRALAAQALDIAAQKLSPEEKTEAERLVSQWKPTGP